MASLAERVADDEVTSADPQARPEELRLLEALLFASAEPIDQATLAKRLPDGVDIKAALTQLQAEYAPRGVNLVRVANKWTFRTAGDLAWLMTRESTETRRLSRAAIEVLAIIAYHQPVTRAEIEEIRGVVTSKGTLDVLLETGWIKPRGRRKTPGRPLTFGTTEDFLSQFTLEQLGDLPGLEELKGTGLLDSRLPTGFTVPSPSDDPTLREDEEPRDAAALDLPLAPRAEPEEDEAHPESKTSENDSSQSHTSEDGTAEREPLANEAAASAVGGSDTAETASAEASSAEYLESDEHQPDTSSREEAEHPEAGQSDHGGAEDADKDDNGETD